MRHVASTFNEFLNNLEVVNFTRFETLTVVKDKFIVVVRENLSIYVGFACVFM
jgi:hypothetical protein